MKHLHFDVETADFYGAYWPCTGGSDCAVIAMIGDDPGDTPLALHGNARGIPASRLRCVEIHERKD